MTTSAIIIAGGQGTRLRSVLPNTPKCLAQVKGVPFIYYILDQLKDAGINNIVLAVGHLANQIIQELGPSYRGIKIQYSIENEPLGTGGAVLQACKLITEESFLALNADSYVPFSIQDMIKFHSSRDAQASLATTQVEDASRFGTVETENYQINSFNEKSGKKEAARINTGIYLFQKEALENFELISGSMELDILPQLIGNGLFAFDTEASHFIDIGLPSDYERAPDFFSELGITNSYTTHSEQT